MPEHDPSKTEKPTPKRLRDARREGNVPVSQDAAACTMLLAGLLLLLLTLSLFPVAFHDILDGCLVAAGQAAHAQLDVTAGLAAGALKLAPLLLAVGGGACGAACIGVWSQVGFLAETEALRMRPEQLNPAEGLRRLFSSGENLVRLILVCARLSLIGFVLFLMLRPGFASFCMLAQTSLPEALGCIRRDACLLVTRSLVGLLALAVADVGWRRFSHERRLMMSREEIKEEMRNSEGDPLVRGRLRRRMRELSMHRLIADVAQASVVVVNPVHVAVALRYEPGMWAPKVMAKGLRKRALRIRQMAADAGIPVIEEPPLARALYKHCPTGGWIPSRFYAAVAVILVRLQKQSSRSPA